MNHQQGNGGGRDTRKARGLSQGLGFGILVSTVLTLVVIPVLYYALYWRRIKPHEDVAGSPGDPL